MVSLPILANVSKIGKFSGTRVAHIIMQYLLQIAVKKALKPEAAIPLIRLGRNQKGKAYQLSDDVWTAAHRYILFNYDYKEVEALIEQHRSLFDVNAKLNKYKRARTHTDEVCEWFKTEIGKKTECLEGNCVIGDRCTWYADEKDHLGFTRVNFNRACQKKDPFVMSTQVHQVFYIEDHVENHIYYPIKKLPTYFDDSHTENSPSEDDINGQFAHDRRFPVVENQDDKANWFRDDVPTKQIPIGEFQKMGGDFMTFNLHHKGEFHKSKYDGGTVNTVKNFELDVFSYSELMEWVNQLGYNGASELDLFIDCDVDKNMLAMRQMQPHVIVRPKRSPVNPKEDNPKKRQFVTLKDINEEKTRKMNKSRKKTQSTDKVLKAVAIERKSDKSDLMGMSEYMKRIEIPDTNKNLGEGAGEGPDGGNAKAYEMQRNKNVEENMKKLKELGIKPLTGKLIKKKDGEKKVEKVVVKTDGPKTRSRTSKMSLPCDKPVNTVEPEENDASEVPIVPIVEKLKQLKNRGPGTMERYLELRKREKEAELEAELEVEMEGQIESLHDIFQSQQAQADAPAEKNKKPRGKSKMKHVHTRGEKREIVLSKLGQPISDDDRLLSEFSNFLGTTVREFVSLTCRTWSEVPDKEILWKYVKDKYIISKEGYKYVMIIMRDQFKGIKLPSRRIITESARKNAEARNKITEAHIVGPRSLAQVCHKMAIERERLAKPVEQIVPISDADVYVKTRKREAKREYKLPTNVVEKKIEDVKKNLKDGNIDAANELVRAGKEHGRSYLVGRLIRKKESKGNSPTRVSDQYLASLTEKIRDELKQEMEEKMDRNVRELRDSIKVMLSKLAKKNPELQIDIEELSKLQPPSEQPPSDATGTSKQPPSDATGASNSSP
ncbi:hypothetical protein AgCh_033197 [Apium graveolens]